MREKVLPNNIEHMIRMRVLKQFINSIILPTNPIFSDDAHSLICRLPECLSSSPPLLLPKWSDDEECYIPYYVVKLDGSGDHTEFVLKTRRITV